MQKTAKDGNGGVSCLWGAKRCFDRFFWFCVCVRAYACVRACAHKEHRRPQGASRLSKGPRAYALPVVHLSRAWQPHHRKAQPAGTQTQEQDADDGPLRRLPYGMLNFKGNLGCFIHKGPQLAGPSRHAAQRSARERGYQPVATLHVI